MSSSLADFASYGLEVDCGTPSCAGARTYRVAELVGVFGKVVTFASLIRRLRCRECGEQPSRVALIQTVGNRRPVSVRTMLRGEV